MPRTAATLAVVALIAVSGCAGFGGPETAGPTPTPTFTDYPTPSPAPTEEPTPAPGATPTASPMRTPTPSPIPSPTPTPTISGDLDPLLAMELPPGVAANGSVDVQRLVGAHRERLRGSQYRLRYTLVNTTAPDTEVTVVNGSRSARVTLRREGTDDRFGAYRSPEEFGLRNTTADQAGYGTGPSATRDVVRFLVAFLRLEPSGYVDAAEWEAVGTTTTDGGEDRVVLRATGTRSAQSLFGPNVDPATVRDVEGRIEVAAEGRIVAGDLRFTVGRSNGSTYQTGIEFASDQFGSADPERPEWLSEPPQVRGQLAADGKLLVVEHTGGATLEAGADVFVNQSRRPVGRDALDTAFEAGDTMYAYKTGTGEDATVEVTVGERPELPADATAFAGDSVTVAGNGERYLFWAGIDLPGTASG